VVDIEVEVNEAAQRGTLYAIEGLSSPPSEQGVFIQRKVLLPPYTKACYYAPFQKYAIDPTLDLWPEGYNQCHPLPLEDLSQAKRGGFFVILQLTDGTYLSLLPVVTTKSMSWLRGDGESLLVETGHWGTEGWDGDVPVLAWACDENLYRACEKVWRHTLEHPLVRGLATMRSEKEYPEPFRYLGWCSWEEFKWDIREEVLIKAIRELDTSPAPVRWVLIDDGHIDQGQSGESLPTNGQHGEVPIHESERRLFSLEANRLRFPQGWKPVLQARQDSKIRWMGVWLNFNGYWGGIHRENALGTINESLLETADGAMQPHYNGEASKVFYDAFIEQQSNEGFDFVKVDNQAKNITFYRGCVPNAVQATMSNHRALEKAVDRNLTAMINCMAHNNLCAFSTRHSQITRCSEDYKKGDLWRAKHHLNNSFANMLWLGQTVWGDHDMFHSSDEVANGVMARSKAISGGPIYLSDHPGDIRMELVKPLCFDDGRILRPLAPAAPLPESAFVNTYEDDEAYRVIAPLSNGCAAIAAYNLTHPEKPVHGKISLDDYRWAAGMMQADNREWDTPPEGILVYDTLNKKATELHGDESINFTIEHFGDAFFILCPIKNGIAVIGRDDKILGPEGVEQITHKPNQLLLSLREEGRILIWSKEAKLTGPNGAPWQSAGSNLWCRTVEGLKTNIVLVSQ
jgi:Raffinose synthase or seed imbibition protein Sip1